MGNAMNYITKGIGGFYYVKTPDGIKECKARGIFRKSGIKPVAGDWVELSPDGTVIDNLTGPIQEAGEGMIAKVENTGTGEATVTVQASSIGVSVGFPLKGVVLYVEDPDTGADVAYTYLDLHEHPAWIRAEGGATNSLLTFEIQSIISSASSVQAIINPNALARIVDLENYALIGHSHQISDIIGLRTELDDHQASLDLLNDLVSGDMPGGINKTADFYTLAGITIRDGIWNQTARTISA